MDKVNDHSNTLEQVITEIQDLASRLSHIEGTKEEIMSITRKFEDHLNTLESQQNATSELRDLIKTLE